MTPEPTAIASILSSYGWPGLCAILMVVCVALFRMLMSEKDERIKEAREMRDLALEMRGDNHLTSEALRMLEASHKRHR